MSASTRGAVDIHTARPYFEVLKNLIE